MVKIAKRHLFFWIMRDGLIGDIGEGKESSSVRKMSVLPVTLQPLLTAQRDCNGLKRQGGGISGRKTSGFTVVATI